MTPEAMDRHAALATTEMAIAMTEMAIAMTEMAIAMTVQGPCAVSGRIREARNDGQ